VTTTTTTVVTTETKQVVVKTAAKPKPAPEAAKKEEGAKDAAIASATSETKTSSLLPGDGLGDITSLTTTTTLPSITVEGGKATVPYDDTDTVFIGLRVYTNKDVPVVVTGKLKEETKEKETTVAATATATVSV